MSSEKVTLSGDPLSADFLGVALGVGLDDRGAIEIEERGVPRTLAAVEPVGEVGAPTLARSVNLSSRASFKRLMCVS